MRLALVVAVLSVLCVFAGIAATTAAKTTGAKRAPAPAKATSGAKKVAGGAGTKKPSAAATKAAPGTKPTGRAKATGKPLAPSSAKARAAKARAAKGKSAAKKAPTVTWRSRQQNPTPERYKEIQQALVAKGYLKGEPSGVWDADSADAMERFQADQKLEPTGKITAASLIGLGLGAKSAGAPEAAPIKSGTTSGPAAPGVIPAPAGGAPAAPGSLPDPPASGPRPASVPLLTAPQ